MSKSFNKGEAMSEVHGRKRVRVELDDLEAEDVLEALSDREHLRVGCGCGVCVLYRQLRDAFRNPEDGVDYR